MKKTTLLTAFFFVYSLILTAQTYTTPNTGVTWTLDDIAAASTTTVSGSGNAYTLSENLVIAENDTFIIDTDLTLSIEADLLITVFGSFSISADDVTITSAETSPYEGFRFEEFSVITIQNTTIENGGGLRVLTEEFTLDNCEITNNVAGGATTGAVISLSRGTPQITNNTITFNELPAIASAANSSVSANISNNYIEGNNMENSNRPQINIGTTQNAIPLIIFQNTIIGNPDLDQVGGIAVSNFVGGAINAEIDENEIRNNRYGISILGTNSFAYIRNNIIEDNNTQGNPQLGGSGISLNSSSPGMDVIASGNEIRGNLWGITVIGEAAINLGNDIPESTGENIFSNNGNGGVIYALYNNTANTIPAANNCWVEGEINTLELAESVIFHQVDDAALGEVLFDPVGCATLSSEDFNISSISIYPNPTTGTIQFQNNREIATVDVFGIQGNKVASLPVSEGLNTLELVLTSGMYFLKFNTTEASFVQKLIIK